MAAWVQTRLWAAGGPTSGLIPIADSNRLNHLVSEVPQSDIDLIADESEPDLVDLSL